MIEELRNWSSLLNTMLGLGAIIYTWLTARSAANAKTLDSHGTKLIDHDRRIQTVEQELLHLPDKDMVHELKLAIVELQGTVRGMGDKLETVNRTVTNIDEFMREEGRK